MRWPRALHLSRRGAVLTAIPVLALAAVGGSYAVNGQMPFTSGEQDCEESPAPTVSPTAEAGDGTGLSLAFSQSPTTLDEQASVTWSFRVTNNGSEAITLTFSSGQDGDVVLTRDGSTAYRWSDGRSFTQALRNEKLGPGETYSFSLQDQLSLEPGTYSLKATVTSDPAPAPVTREVQVGSDSSPSPTPSDASPTPESSITPGPVSTPSQTATPSPTPEEAT